MILNKHIDQDGNTVYSRVITFKETKNTVGFSLVLGIGGKSGLWFCFLTRKYCEVWQLKNNNKCGYHFSVNY